MNESILTSVVLPLSLAIIMFGMGLSLVMDDFKRVVKFPKAIFMGLTNQLIFLPLLGFLLAKIFGLPPILAVGLMILAACPGGVTSNLITHVARGDTALSITLTAICSIVTVITIPIIISLSMTHFLAESQEVQLDIGRTIVQIFGITVLPVGIGMLLRKYKPAFSKKMESPSRIASTVIFVVIVAGIIAANKEVLLNSIESLGTVVIALNVLTMGLGFGASRLLKLNLPQSLSISIESGIQNGTLAIVIASSILKQPEMSLPGALYSLVMFVSAAFIMAYFGTRKVKVGG